MAECRECARHFLKHADSLLNFIEVLAYAQLVMKRSLIKFAKLLLLAPGELLLYFARLVYDPMVKLELERVLESVVITNS